MFEIKGIILTVTDNSSSFESRARLTARSKRTEDKGSIYTYSTSRTTARRTEGDFHDISARLSYQPLDWSVRIPLVKVAMT